MHDPGHMILRRALRVAIVLPLAYVVVMYGLKMPGGAAFAGFGTFVLLSFADFGGPTRDRARAYLYTGLVGLLAITIGTVAAANIWVAIGVTFVVATGLVYSGVLRGYVASATTAVLLPFVIAVTAPGDLASLWQRLIGFTVAVVLSTVAALVLWPVHVRSSLRLRVAETLSASANVVRALWPEAVVVGKPVSPVDLDSRIRELTQANNHLRDQYDGRLLRPGAATARDRALMQLIDEVTRLQMFLLWRPDDDELLLGADDDLARVTADTLDSCGNAIGRGGPPPDASLLDSARETHRSVTEVWAGRQLEAGKTAKVSAALDAGFHLRLIAVVTELIARHTRVAVGAPPELTALSAHGQTLPLEIDTPWATLRRNFTLRSPWLRNSLRSGLALTLAVAVAGIGQIQHPFWVVLGALTALRFDAIGTGRTAVQAIVGTVGGFLVGTGLLLLVGDHPVALWILFPIAVFLSGYTPGAISLMVGQGSFTVFVIIFYALIAGPQIVTGEIRVIDVSLGIAISLVVSALMWPRGVMARIRTTLIDSVHASTAYLVVAYDRLLNGASIDDQADAARLAAAKALSFANETFDLAVSQGGPGAMKTDAWAWIANASDQVATSADLITFLARSGHSPIGCPAATDTMFACAHAVQAKLNASVDRLNSMSDLDPTSAYANADVAVLSGERLSAVGDPFIRLRESVAACMSGWQTLPPSSTRNLGQSAISLVWAEDWLIHLAWVANRTDLLTRPPNEVTHQ